VNEDEVEIGRKLDEADLVCWFCHVCKTLMLLREAMKDGCPEKVRPRRCPRPLKRTKP